MIDHFPLIFSINCFYNTLPFFLIIFVVTFSSMLPLKSNRAKSSSLLPRFHAYYYPYSAYESDFFKKRNTSYVNKNKPRFGISMPKFHLTFHGISSLIQVETTS